ncbi:MAG: CHAT domain-containing protein [Candidatus Saccharimonas sp.]|nr:CHAT domain-containing protein [Planctomycetaceae bacterium]
MQGVETILISPDGVLAQLPWDALPGEKPGTYLLEDLALAVIPVLQMLPSLLGTERRVGLPESLLLARDIEYGGDPGQPQDILAKRDAAGRLRDGRMNPFSKLPAAQAEMTSIKVRYERAIRNSKQHGTVEPLGEGKATEIAFREQAAKHQWLHVITHGCFAPETVRSAKRSTGLERDNLFQPVKPRPVQGEYPGLLSGLAFAGANTPPEPEKDDGILTALEVAALDLNQVDAVVQSSCETGLGSVAGGEGLLGLQRAFQVSGARTVVASLWKVPDAPTACLMQRFYENLWDKQMSKLETLREVQLWMLKEGARATDGAGERGIIFVESQPPIGDGLLPYYWAAFVLSGDWR